MTSPPTVRALAPAKVNLHLEIHGRRADGYHELTTWMAALDLVDEVHEQAGRRVPTTELNRWLQDVSRAERASPARGRSVNLLYATQTGVHPPRFVIFCNDVFAWSK